MKKTILTAIASVLSVVLIAQSYRGQANKSYFDKLNDRYSSGIFKSTQGTILDLTGDNTTAIAYPNILDWMQGRVAGLQVYTFRSGTRIPFIRGHQAQIYIDEMPVSAGFLNALSSVDIAMIKVIKGPFAGSFGNGGGVIAIYTFKGDEEEEKE